MKAIRWSRNNPIRVRVRGDKPSPTLMAAGIGGSNNSTQYEVVKYSRMVKRRGLDSKPPYRVPSMAEITAFPRSGYSVVSTFSGAGGSCLGYKMAGLSVLWANEMEPNAAECYRANFPDSILDTRDIRSVEPEEILSAIEMEKGEIDLLDGSPPCQSFSTAGKREKHWGKIIEHEDGTTQRADDLFFEFARILRGLMPKVFVAENVSGLVKGVAKGYFLMILKELKSCGYIVETKLLDAQWLGVPQMRQRVIFVGVRSDLAEKSGVAPAFPAPLPYRYSVTDAIGDLIGPSEKPEKPWPTVTSHIAGETGFNPPRRILVRHGDGFGAESWRDAGKQPSQTIGASPTTGNNCNNGAATIRFVEDTGGRFSYGDFTRGPSPTVRAGEVGHLKVEGDISRFAIGKEWGKLKPGQKSKKYLNLARAHPEDPSPTVTASGGEPSIASMTHPVERRKFTIAELKRICAFSDDFILKGSYSQQWARLGNSVPPIMMFWIARTIRDEILSKIK